MKWPPPMIIQGRSSRSPAEGASMLSFSVHFSQEVAYPGQGVPSADRRECGHPHFSFSERFFHLSSPVKSLPKPCPNHRGKHLLSHAEIVWELYSSSDHHGPLLRPRPRHLQAMLEKRILTPWFKALPYPPKAFPLAHRFFPGLQLKKAERCILPGNVSSRQPHPRFPFHKFHAVLPQDDTREGTSVVIFVRRVSSGVDPTL